MEVHRPDWHIGPPLRELIAGTPDDDLEIADVDEVAIDGTTFLVPDFGDHRILRIDTMFDLLDRFGSEGAGPGELMRPTMAVPWNDEIVVGEWGNGRFSVFDNDGNFRRTIPAASRPQSHGVRSDGGIVTPSASLDHYAIALASDGSAKAFAPRPPSLRAEEGEATLGGEDTRLLVGPGDTTHVLDNEWGILLKYDGDGRLIYGRTIPNEVMAPVREYRRKFVEAFARQGRRVVGMALINSMAFNADGSIIIRIGHGGTAAIVVDPADYSMRRINVDAEDPVYGMVRESSSALVVHDTYYVFARAGLAAHPILRGPE